MSHASTKILLVEDNTGDAGLLRAAFSEVSTSNFSFRLVHAERVTQALACLTQEPFDVVLLDLSLPDAGGLETIVRVRDAAPSLPIVIMTGLDDENVAVEAIRQGAQDYLVKGQVDSGVLVRAIRCAIERKRIESQLQYLRNRDAVLRDVNVALTSTLDLKSVLDVLLGKIGDMLPGFATTIRLRNSETEVWDPVACRNLDENHWRRVPALSSGAGLTAAVVAARKPVVVSDVQNDPCTRDQDFMIDNGLVSFLGVPLFSKGEILGVLGLYAKTKHEFVAEEVEFIDTLGGQAAIAISNSRLYEQIKTAHDALEKVLEIKSVLVGVMAHELKTPIQVIMGSAGLLAEGICGELTRDQRERVKVIEHSADELVQLIESALDMIRLEHGKMPLFVTEVRVSALLTELKSEFEDAFGKKGVELVIHSPEPEFVIKTDLIKIKEVLRNLIENARKFTRQGRVEVQFRANKTDRVEFVVKDTGIGIPNELVPKIFDLFYQIDSSHREHASGGLGLNIVKRLVGAMSGEIDVKSEVGKGTTFRIILPNEISAVRRD
jgi:signal transduction histidine kinase/ActR/RegA family two-component response regulator